MGPNNGPSAAFNPNSYPPRDLLAEATKLVERLTLEQTAATVLSGLVMGRGNTARLNVKLGDPVWMSDVDAAVTFAQAIRAECIKRGA